MPRTEAELNEYLAKAAGIVWHPESPGFWLPDGGFLVELPTFTDDLQACVRWLRPKFRMVEMKSNSIGTSVKINTFEGRDFFSGLTLGENAFALAFCRAAEKALDAGAKP